MKKLLLILTAIFSQLYFSQSDCITALPVCGNSGISYTPSGSGTVQEDLGGCLLSDEHYSVWYSFTIAQGGTLEFTITPNVFSDDYDFAVYGPNTPCTALGAPIRCNYSGADGPTGLGNNANDPNGANTNGVPGQWSSLLNVVAGETYYLVVDNFLSTANGFSLTWGGTAILNSPFTDPVLQPFPFIKPGPAQDGKIPICVSPSPFDFSTLSAGIINGNANFSVSYHYTSNDALLGANPITTVINVTVGTKYYYSIKYTDPTNPANPLNSCRQVGEIEFVIAPVVINNTTLTACNNNKTNQGEFNLNNALSGLYGGPATAVFYQTLADLNAGTNPITNPSNFISTVPNTVYALVTNAQGCSGPGVITLDFKEQVLPTDATLVECFDPEIPTTAIFNLNNAATTTDPAHIRTYFLSLQDAINNTNAISNPVAYRSVPTEVFVRVTNSEGCWGTAKITLKVTPPTYSTVLKNKTICAESTTTLDPGADFDGYIWSTGAVTQTISNVSIGEYWVDLYKNGCYTRQNVSVFAFAKPVIVGAEITNASVTLAVTGGTAPYQYSIDNVVWQSSATFNNLPRGMNTFYVKDANNCEPVAVELTVPNLINAITPDGDGFNDVIDYRALALKKDFNFSVYDRYGNRLHVADGKNGYSWNGMAGGKKLITGTYWYAITWIEPTGITVKFNDWILVKNK